MGSDGEIYLQHGRFGGRLWVPDQLFGKENPDQLEAPNQALWVYHLSVTLEKLADFQAAEASAGTPAWYTVYHDTDMPSVREGDVLRILTQLHKGIGPVISCVDEEGEFLCCFF